MVQIKHISSCKHKNSCAIIIVMSDLYEKTMRLLNATTQPMAEVAASAGVGLRWLYDLKAGRFSDPGVNRIQRIYNHLTNNMVANSK